MTQFPASDDARWTTVARDGVRMGDLLAQIERDHVEALAENVAHDAAMEKAQDLTAAMLVQFATPRSAHPGRMPETLRNRISHQRSLTIVPPSIGSDHGWGDHAARILDL